MTARRSLAALLVVGLLAQAGPALASPAPEPPVEQQLTGEVVRLAVENLDGESHELTAVVPDGGDAVRVEADALADVPAGTVVEITTAAPTQADQDPAVVGGGVEVAAVDVVAEAAPDGDAADGAAHGATDGQPADPPLGLLAPGTRPIHVITATVPGQRSDGYGVAALAEAVENGVDGYWRASTDGQVGFAVGNRLDGGRYDGWDADAGCSTAEVFQLFDWSARRLGVFPTARERRHSVTYTPRVADCWFGGIAHIADGGSAWVNGGGNTPGIVDLISHEVGHTLTLGHSSTRFACSGGPDGAAHECLHVEYGDGYDVMGSASGPDGLVNGAHLATMGLLTPASSIRATTATTAVLTPVGAGRGTRFLRIDGADGVVYVVEYRAAVGTDEELGTVRRACPVAPTPCRDPLVLQPGVVVHRLDTGAPGVPSYLLDVGAARPGHDPMRPDLTLEPGRSFTTADRSWTVMVDRVGDTATVRVVPGADPRRFVPVGPVRVHDHRAGVPADSPVCVQITGASSGVPADATGVVLNVATVRPTSVGHVVVYPEGGAAPATSTVNLSPGRDVANAAFVALPHSGRVCYLVRGHGEPGVVIDVTGYLRPGSGVTLAAPRRLHDNPRVAPGETVTVQVTGELDVPEGATAVVLNVAGAHSTSSGNLRLWAADQPMPGTSTLTYAPSGDRANAAVVELSDDGALSYRSDTAGGRPVRVVLDVVGYVTDGSAYVPVPQKRLLDTRKPGAGRLPAGALVSVDVGSDAGVPEDATAVVLNVVGVSPSGNGHLRVFPSREHGSVPDTATLNYIPGPGEDVANLVVTGIGEGRRVSMLSVQASPDAQVDLVVDVVGYLTDGPSRPTGPRAAP